MAGDGDVRVEKNRQRIGEIHVAQRFIKSAHDGLPIDPPVPILPGHSCFPGPTLRRWQKIP